MRGCWCRARRCRRGSSCSSLKRTSQTKPNQTPCKDKTWDALEVGGADGGVADEGACGDELDGVGGDVAGALGLGQQPVALGDLPGIDLALADGNAPVVARFPLWALVAVVAVGGVAAWADRAHAYLCAEERERTPAWVGAARLPLAQSVRVGGAGQSGGG